MDIRYQRVLGLCYEHRSTAWPQIQVDRAEVTFIYYFFQLLFAPKNVPVQRCDKYIVPSHQCLQKKCIKLIGGERTSSFSPSAPLLPPAAVSPKIR